MLEVALCVEFPNRSDAVWLRRKKPSRLAFLQSDKGQSHKRRF